jgi:foldase protein PrsA
MLAENYNMPRTFRKKKLNSSEQLTARLSHERGRKSRQTTYIISGIVVATIVTIFSVFYYLNSVAPFHKVIIKVDDVEIRMDYFLERTRLVGSDPMDMLYSLADETVIKLAAPRYGVNVTQSDIDLRLRSIAEGSENHTISEAEFKEWYRQQLNDSGLSEDLYRELIGTQLLVSRLKAYLAPQTNTTVEHVYLHLIAVQTYDEARKVVSRLNDGESFAAVAYNVSLDTTSKENGGDIGWVPRGVTSLDDTAFSLAIGEISEPLPYYPEGTYTPSIYYIIMVSDKAVRQAEEKYIPALQANAFKQWLSAEETKYTISYHGLKDGFDSETYAWINYQLSKTGTS